MAHPRIRVTLAVNGYDDGASTGEVRRFLGDALGPSDFRKNASHAAAAKQTASASLIKLLDARLPVDVTSVDAVAWLRDPSHDWEVAIVDLVLVPGGGSGFGVLNALRDRDPARKMIVLTGTASPEVRQRCLQLGADGVFDKSMETEAMLDYCATLTRVAD